jgi:anti-anti-sigma factor
VSIISTEVLSDGVLVLRPTGPLTMTDEADAALIGAFNDAVDKSQLRILLDLTEVHSMDSSGIAALVRGWTRVRRADGDVVIAGPAQSIRRMLTITRLMALFKIAETVDEGLEQLRRGDHRKSTSPEPPRAR